VSKADKILQQMQNPVGWRIDSLKIARAHNIEWRPTSHVVFVRADGRTLVPAHRPIKPIYIKKYVDFVLD
jgi:hypothetical protein